VLALDSWHKWFLSENLVVDEGSMRPGY